MKRVKIFDFSEDENYPEYYKVCRNTGAYYFLPAKSRVYEDSYFMEEYKSQYKKTYYEDESFLRKIAKERILLVHKYLKSESPSVFEIGCAAGFFLDEARQSGFTTKGIEISENEVRYAKSLGLNVVSGSFENYQPKEKYDLVSSYFVLEHFENQEEILWKIESMVKENGLFMLACPSFDGPTFRTNPKNWFLTHPKDHFVDYDPLSLSRVFDKMGMKIVFQKPFSYHKHRDLGWKGKFLSNFVYKTLADWTCYGDTIQIIAKKVKI
ncbi:MAG: class I SAM-dependent methyltransferase [Leptospiraceae bacterium]|nr:class I SAM-dependent methyltransferase [Leptospiraceae bacterium]MCK6382009.1 class I SAM-dependent methyltransferase [Leptospiraceae bacterium]NUM40380.1 class I SAM-dependent methyltransferase [Leptospiraceae bacterium]